MKLYRSAIDSGIARDARGVGDLAVLARGNLEKARKRSQIAGQRLGLDLLNEIGFGIGSKIILWNVGGHRHGQHAETQRTFRIELEGELRRHQRIHGRRDGTAGQQVDTAAAQLARTRTREHEAQPMGLDETMDLVQQRGNLLHLVDHHPASAWQGRELPVQRVRVLAQSQRLPGVQQIVGDGVGKAVTNPGGLAGSARAEQKDRAGRRWKQSCVHGYRYYRKIAHDMHIFPEYWSGAESKPGRSAGRSGFSDGDLPNRRRSARRRARTRFRTGHRARGARPQPTTSARRRNRSRFRTEHRARGARPQPTTSARRRG